MSSSYPNLPENTNLNLIHQPSISLTERTALINSSCNLSIQEKPNQSHNSDEIQPLSSEEVNNVAINLCLEIGCILLGILGICAQIFGLYVWTGMISQGVIPSLGTLGDSFYFISLILKVLDCLLAIYFGFSPSSQTAIRFYPAQSIIYWVLIISWGIFIFVAGVLSQLGFLYSAAVWGTVVGVLLAEYLTYAGAGLCLLLSMRVFKQAVSAQLKNGRFQNVFIAPPPLESSFIEMREKL